MPEDTIHGSKGGLARRDALEATERKAIARKGADARWGTDLPRATHDGALPIGDSILVAAVLANGKRLLSQGTLLQAIGRSRTPKAGTGGFSTVDELPFFLNAEVLKPFISEELLVSTTPIHFRLRSGQRSIGYDALMLPMVLDVYLGFRDYLLEETASGDPASALYKRYSHIIKACDKLRQGMTIRGIIALVDDATGYQNERVLEDIQRLVIEAYVSPKLHPWTQRFFPEFFKQIYRLYGWEYKPGNLKHPGYVGKFINKYVYDALPEGVLEELRKTLPKNEKGNRRAKLWQALTAETGSPHLDDQLKSDVLLMQTSLSPEDFDARWKMAFGKQRQLPLEIAKALNLLS
jgi:hypothetical protein